MITIFVSISQFSKSIDHSIMEAEQQKALEQTSQLPLYVSQFCTASSNVAAGIYLGQNTLDNELQTEFEQSKEKQDELQVKIKEQIIAYGSNDAIKVFVKFENLTRNQGSTNIEAYYLLPLLMAQVKVDVTGEVTNPITLFHLLMPQFKSHDERAVKYINDTVKDLKLDSRLTASPTD